jgi:hypothetical protein
LELTRKIGRYQYTIKDIRNGKHPNTAFAEFRNMQLQAYPHIEESEIVHKFYDVMDLKIRGNLKAPKDNVTCAKFQGKLEQHWRNWDDKWGNTE